jgi:cytochrome c
VRLSVLVTSALAALCVASASFAEDIGDADKGAKVFNKCKACHQVGADAKNRVGPHLNGVFGRKAAAFEDYKYSKSMERASADGLIWTEETLDAFFENPKSLVSKTKMNFKGLKKEKDRANLLAYLRTFSDDPANIPEAEPTAHQSIVPPEVLAIVGDAEYGEYLSSDCMTCHQASGGDDGIPSIVGWPEEDFAVAMHAYKQKLRPHPVMQMMAGRLSNEEIAALAAYFKGLE